MDVLSAEGIEEEAGVIIAAFGAALGARRMYDKALASFERALFLARRRREPLDLADILLRLQGLSEQGFIIGEITARKNDDPPVVYV